MELPVSLQAQQFFLSALLGVGFGFVYDALCAMRRQRPKLTAAADVFFGLFVLLALLLSALYIGGGRFRLFFFGGILLGAVFYFLALSRMMLAFWAAFWRFWGRMFALIRRPLTWICKKIAVFSKNIYASVKKWGTMFGKMVYRQFSAYTAERRAKHDEIRQIVPARETGDPDFGGVRYHYPGVAAVADLGTKRRGRKTDQQHRRRRTGKRQA
ncbi:MAG: spore cortex biosynthesis protein YabQ [Oscillospiraceae bacterium]|nr:spore cortex biosynthesis protein YabQ [Oscillospiraceae bacterium]